jgi:cob(I)alamin adenosyltransferase
MVRLNKIYTRTGDDGTTGLGSGERRRKDDLRVEAYGTVDEANAALGLARVAMSAPDVADMGHMAAMLDPMLLRIQNDLFDLGADLCTPPSDTPLDYEPLRIIQDQVDRLEREIDALNAGLAPLRSFVLPGGTSAAAALHLARTIARRAERLMVALAAQEQVGAPALKYINRLSDFLFVASRYVNHKAQDDGGGDVLWVPGQNR